MSQSRNQSTHGRRRRRRPVPIRGIILVAAWFGIASGGCGGGGGGGSDPVMRYVLAPEQAHFGATYAEWSARWWQWCYELPRTNHPLFDETGTEAWRGQVDPVWFLGGVYNASGSAERTITIPSDKSLFFPILNGEWDNTACVSPDTNYSFTELHSIIAAIQDTAVDIYCDLDGVRIIDAPTMAAAARWRAQSADFSVWYPADNLFAWWCGDPGVPGIVSPVAGDGIYVMLAPLPVGEHTLHFSGKGDDTPGAFWLDIIYHITVVP